jgi:serine/threonine protein kinase
MDSEFEPTSAVEELVTEYIDRINRGEILSPKQILADHPRIGNEVLHHLKEFIELGAEFDSPAPLGTLGDYTLRRQIGRGGMGVVYDAWENSMNRSVALKVLPAAIAADRKAYTRFMREAQAAGQLAHPNLVPVHAAGFKEDTPYYAMELIDGETLAQVLPKIRDADPGSETPFGPKDHVDYFTKLARAFADVAEGLQHAHAKGVTHRDIKPSNLILDHEGRLRVLDFGLARLEGQESLTASGDFVGTPLYMSPEQARRRKIPLDHRTDIYSLGATLYEMLAGRPPFKGKDHQDTLSQIIERDPVEPGRVNQRVPRDLETVALKCLRKEPGDRYATAEALAEDLRRFASGEPVVARPQGRWEKFRRRIARRRRVLVIRTLTIAVLLACGAPSATSGSRTSGSRASRRMLHSRRHGARRRSRSSSTPRRQRQRTATVRTAGISGTGRERPEKTP